MSRRNTGSIKEKRPGVWQIAVDVSTLTMRTDAGWACPTGKQHRRYVTIHGTREDAERERIKMLYERDTGTLPTEHVTVSTLADWWLRAVVAPAQRPRTVDDYTRQVRVHINPALGKMDAHKVKPHHVQEFYNRKRNALGASSISKLDQILRGIFDAAWRNDVVGTNPMSKVTRPKSVGGGTRRRDWLTIDQVEDILADMESHGGRFAVLCRLLAGTGLRIGETLALEWRHIDLVGRKVVVEQTTTTTADGKLTIGPPKSENGYRVVPIMDDALIAALVAHRTAQDTYRESMGEAYTPYEDETGKRWLVFPKVRPNQAGGLLANRQVQQAVAAYGTRPHALRHFYASQLFEAGARLPRVSRLMGHANIHITSGTYLHLDDEGNRDDVALFAERLAAAREARQAEAISGAIAATHAEALLADTEIGKMAPKRVR